MELKKVLIGMILLTGLVISTISCVNAFSVTGKQNVDLRSGENKCCVTVTNTGSSLLIVDLKPTIDQYFSQEEISFPLNVRWDEIFNKYEWKKVDWIDAKNTKTIILPNKKENMDFTINVPDNITSGTLYAKIEVKDASEKEGMVIIRNVYISQISGRLSNNVNVSGDTNIPSFSLLMFLLSITLVYYISKKKK